MKPKVPCKICGELFQKIARQIYCGSDRSRSGCSYKMRLRYNRERTKNLWKSSEGKKKIQSYRRSEKGKESQRKYREKNRDELLRKKREKWREKNQKPE
jgi:hypothetical protein